MGKTIIDAKRTGALFALDPDKVVLVTDPDHPLYDERAKLAPDKRLVQSILDRGVIKPIVVRRNGQYIEVVDGKRRVTAAREANRLLREQMAEPIMVPGIVRGGDDSDLYGVLVAANEFSLGDSIQAKARKAQHLLNLCQDEDRVANAFGVTVQCLHNWQKIMGLDPAVRKAIDEGKLSASAALALSSVDRAEQKLKLAELLQGQDGAKRPTVARAAKAAGVKSNAPGKRAVRKLFGLAEERVKTEDALVRAAFAGMAWAIGDISVTDLCSEIPAMASFAHEVGE